MWISLIVALLTYLMQSRDTSEERRKALLTSAAAGAVTYGVTEYTDWGKENIKPLDTKISNVFSGSPDPTTTTTGVVKQQSTNGWDVLKGFGPTGIATVGLGVGAATGNKNIIWIAAAGFAALVLLK